MKGYVLTAKAHPWLLSSFEESLRHVGDGTVSDASKLSRGLRGPVGRPISKDEVLVALNALCDLEIFTRVGLRYQFDKTRFESTEQLRKGIQVAVATIADTSPVHHPEAQLCVSLPPSLSPAAEHVIRESSVDLRSSVLDVMASAKQTLIVASPFWDADTTAEMVSLARKKLNSGVEVWLLGRFSQELPSRVRTELRKVAREKGCSILSWFEGAGADIQTFHFKAVSVDRGLRGYMGSANMTVSSLRSRMELGVILIGSAAEHLDRVLRVVITMSSSISV
jgi:PLD-like domain